MQRPAKVIAAGFGLTAFAVAVVAGIAADNPSQVVLKHAIIAMICCQVVGLFIGALGERVVNDAVAEYQSRHPIPKPDSPGSRQRSDGARTGRVSEPTGATPRPAS